MGGTSQDAPVGRMPQNKPASIPILAYFNSNIGLLQSPLKYKTVRLLNNWLELWVPQVPEDRAASEGCLRLPNTGWILLSLPKYQSSILLNHSMNDRLESSVFGGSGLMRCRKTRLLLSDDTDVVWPTIPHRGKNDN